MADVIRGGHQARVGYGDLVVGDVVLVNAGLVLPADGVLVGVVNRCCILPVVLLSDSEHGCS